MVVRHLPAITIEGQAPGQGTPDHPMRIVTRRAAGLEAGGWTDEVRRDVAKYFDDMAEDWESRTTPERVAVVVDALTRGLDALPPPDGMAVEVGSGTGTYSAMLARHFRTVMAVDLSMEMLIRAPGAPAHRVQADGSALPFRDKAAAAVVLINAFLFPSEVARVLSADGIVVWVNTAGEQTPIYLPVNELVERLPGAWDGVTSRAGEGLWCVLRRA